MIQNKISIKNQDLLDRAKIAGLQTDTLIETYGLRFTIRLLKSVRKNKSSRETIYPLFPKFKVSKNNSNHAIDEFYQILEASNFKIYEWLEPFVDEDTWEVVEIQRRDIYTVEF